MLFPKLHDVMMDSNIFPGSDYDYCIFFPDLDCKTVRGKWYEDHMLNAVADYGDYFVSRIDFEAMYIEGASVWICAQKEIKQISVNKKGEK